MGRKPGNRVHLVEEEAAVRITKEVDARETATAEGAEHAPGEHTDLVPFLFRDACRNVYARRLEGVLLVEVEESPGKLDFVRLSAQKLAAALDDGDSDFGSLDVLLDNRLVIMLEGEVEWL